MPPAPVIREYNAKDEAAVVSLWRDCGLVVPWNDPVGDISLALGSGHGQLFVARQDGRVVGAVMVGHDGHRGWIYYLAVAPDNRRSRLGQRLVETCENWISARGLAKIQLMIRRANMDVQAFYKEIGYDQSDVVVMQRWLTPKANESG